MVSQKTADKIEKVPVRRTNYALIIYIRFQKEQKQSLHLHDYNVFYRIAKEH